MTNGILPSSGTALMGSRSMDIRALSFLVLSLALIVVCASCFQFAATSQNGQDPVALPESTDQTLRKAETGEAASQRKLGSMYCSGEEVPQDYQEAAKWYTKAANQEDAKAQYELALMYAKGLGVEQDEQQALWWLLKAADHGDAEAQYTLGNAYDLGSFVERNY